MLDVKAQKDKVKSAFTLYAKLGWHVIPCVTFLTTDKDGKTTRQKTPLVSWKNYQTSPPTDTEIQTWLDTPSIINCLGIGVVTGRGIVGIDFDQKDGKPNTTPWADELMDTMYTITASGGMHAYFSTPAESTPSNATNIFKADKLAGDTIVDVRGSGGFIVVGPTVLWETDPRFDNNAKPVATYRSFNVAQPSLLKPLPDTFLKTSQEIAAGPKKWTEIAKGAIPPGSRHDTAKSIIGKLLAKATSTSDIALAKASFYQIMSTSFPDPLPNEEVEAIFNWTIKQQQKKPESDFDIASSLVASHVQKQKELFQYQEDMALWEKCQLTHMEVTDTLTILHTKDKKRVRVKTEAILSQNQFRSAFFLSTGEMLPTIRKRSFETLLGSTPSTRIEGVDSREVMERILITWISEADSVENPLELEERLRRSPMVTVVVEGKTRIYFSMPYLIRAIQREIPNTPRGLIFDTARSAGCQEVKLGEFQFWFYERP